MQYVVKHNLDPNIKSVWVGDERDGFLNQKYPRPGDSHESGILIFT